MITSVPGGKNSALMETSRVVVKVKRLCVYMQDHCTTLARELCTASLSFTFCSVPFKGSGLCTVFSVCCCMDRSPVISGCDYKCWDCRFTVEVCLHHSSSATNKHHALRVKLDVDPISGMKQESWFNIIYPVGTSRVLWVRLTHSLSELVKCLISCSQKSPV